MARKAATPRGAAGKVEIPASAPGAAAGLVTVQLAAVALDAGWRREDLATDLKLAASLRKYGQLRPLVVRTDEAGAWWVVDGRRQLRVMRSIGWTAAQAIHVGTLSDADARRMALSLDLAYETDYARVAAAVAELVDGGVSVAELASGSPFTEERVAHFRTLATFDWSVFDGQTDQHAMDWDAEEAPTPADVLPHEELEPMGPDSFGGEDFPSEPPAATMQAVAETLERHAPPAGGPKRKPKPESPQLSLWGDEAPA
jgi:hypothetical protein